MSKKNKKNKFKNKSNDKFNNIKNNINNVSIPSKSTSSNDTSFNISNTESNSSVFLQTASITSNMSTIATNAFVDKESSSDVDNSSITNTNDASGINDIILSNSDVFSDVDNSSITNANASSGINDNILSNPDAFSDVDNSSITNANDSSGINDNILSNSDAFSDVDNSSITNTNDSSGINDIILSNSDAFSDVDNSSITNTNDASGINDKQSSSYIMVKNKKSKKLLTFLIILMIIILLALIGCTIFGLLNLGNTKIINGTFISGIDVSGLSKEEAFKKVNSSFSEKLSCAITLKHNDYETSVFAEQFDVNFDINDAIDKAYNRGRNGNIFENNFDIINSYFSSVNISPSFSYSDESITALITEIEPNLPDRAIASTYYIEGNNLVISKGVNGIIISNAELKSELIYYFNNLLCKDAFIDIPVENMTIPKVDLNKIHEEIYKAPQDAYYTSNPYVVHPHVDGIDFGISIEEASALLNMEGESCNIPLKVLSPNVTTNQIGPEAFPDLLGEFSTTYNSSNYNRSTNISLASSKINGIVIMPGEVFSYNQTVGKRTAAAGFKSAGVYVNGQVSTDIGGGICQVSSTLYNAILLANLEIVERTNHYFNPGYVEAGKDATVSWGGPDFRFKNNRNYPIKIVCSGTGGKVNFKIWGLHTDDDYDVVIESKYIQSVPYKTIQKSDPSLAKGTTKVIESGSNGCKTETYKILKKNGAVVSRTLLSRDTYNPHNRVVAVGN